jgi:hypothetical protein
VHVVHGCFLGWGDGSQYAKPVGFVNKMFSHGKSL